MKFAYSTSIFKMRSLKDAVDSVAKAGFEAVELMADRPHVFPQDFKASEISTLHECLERRKLKVISLGAGRVSALGDGHHPSWIEEDWKERELRIRYTLDCLRLAAALGVPSISILPGGKIPQSMNQREAWRLFVANLHRVLPLARKLAVTHPRDARGKQRADAGAPQGIRWRRGPRGELRHRAPGFCGGRSVRGVGSAEAVCGPDPPGRPGGRKRAPAYATR